MLLLLTFASISCAASVHAEPVLKPTPPARVPDRIPAEEAPGEVNQATSTETVYIPPSEGQSAPPRKPTPERIPAEEAPDELNQALYTETAHVPGGVLGMPQPFLSVTLTYGFEWYQHNPWTVGVSGVARTEADDSVQEISARARLWRDEEHDGIWEYLETSPDAKDLGACGMDSAKAQTGFWFSPDGTTWKVKTFHYIIVNGQKTTWEKTKYDCLP